MSAEEHRAQASQSVKVQILVVSTSRDAETDTAGPLIAERLRAVGHEVLGRQVVPDDIGAIRAAFDATTAPVVVVTGGTGLTAADVTPEALVPRFTRRIPGFGELFRMLSYAEVGAAALLSRATAGLVGDQVVFLLPGSRKACLLAVDKLIAPDLAHLVHHVGVAGRQQVDAPPEAEDVAVADDTSAEDANDAAEDEPALPAPSGRLGRLGSSGVSVGMGQHSPDEPGPVEVDGVPDRGWKRALYELQAELHFDRRHELPEEIARLAPVTNLLDTAGEVAVITLPSKAEYAVYGWPDLRRPSSKVLAVSWGDPLAEVLALHRYPTMSGTCVDEKRGLLPKAWEDVARVAEEVLGRAPRDCSGKLFAVQGDAVWMLRGRRVIRWDGRKETDEGTPKQALSSLMLHWSNR